MYPVVCFVSAGPSQCHAITYCQTQGKTLDGGAFKGFIRSRVPDVCPVGALLRHISVRLAVVGEQLPAVGTAAWNTLLFYPGQRGKC